MEKAMKEMEQRQVEVKHENERIQEAIEVGRQTDTNVNQGASEAIKAKDIEFQELQKELHDTAEERLQNLQSFNSITTDATEQTQNTENMLRQKDSKRHEIQV